MTRTAARAPKLLTASDLEWLHKATEEGGGRLRFKVVTESDAWLGVCYEFLCRHFQPDVIDPRDRFVEWLDLNSRGVHPFPFLLIAAYVVESGEARVAGVLSGNLMHIERSHPQAPEHASRAYFFAIGNLLTDTLVREAGMKGVGTRLWRRSITEARSTSRKLGGRLEYSFVESEDESVGFWDRLGYRWPQGVAYWQPPLEFDEHGNFLHVEVPEIPMIKPVDVHNKRTIKRQVVHDVIATVFRNWALHKYRTTLSPEAMQRAEEYVMGSLLGRVEALMPHSPEITLVRLEPGQHPG